MLLAQISDCHVVEPGELFVDRVDSAAGLRRAVATLNELPTQPDLVIGTGDLVNDGTAEQYDHLEQLLAELDAPFLPMPGNHDDRTQLRYRYPELLPAGDPDDPIDFVVDVGELRLVALDTTIPGQHDGRVTAEQLAWLDTVLAESTGRPTIVAQHHPPVLSGVGSMDEECGFDGRLAEAGIVARHAHVEAVVSGHLHRAFHRRFAGTVATTCPSTACQLELTLGGAVTRYTDEPTGFLLHEWRDGIGLTTHVVPTGDHEVWSPSWAG